ncbi:DUF6773 family protein [Paenibacillus sp. MMS20-IR301]|uniref:DUF6773 family protein n=1 Tax=Paenibacillus sp. MMS20-IR301 TaxID=2895946 RepID=UPI0028E9C05E|nr:DUF6773 family protein [Paenibacillus sp. MMS20-IR301]WNS45097.1 DUF6773 family protein [Paenibacillus sp. MMS20-IR301]
MKERAIKDERITAELQSLNSHGFMIVFAGIMVSLLVKVFILQWDMKYWLDTFLILMAACLYITVRGIRSGLYLLPDRKGDVKRLKKMNLIAGAAGSLVWGILMFIDELTGSGKADLGSNIVSTVVGMVVFFLGITGLQWLWLKRSTKNANNKLE